MALCRGVNLVSESSPQVIKTTVAHMPPILEHLSLPRCDLGVRAGLEGAGGSVSNQGCEKQRGCRPPPLQVKEAPWLVQLLANSFKGNIPAP